MTRLRNLSLWRARLLGMALLLNVGQAWASYQFDRTSTYRISCYSSPGGSTCVGSEHGQNTPVYYAQNGSKLTEDMYWYIIEVRPGCYALQNAKTKQFMTYDGIRSGSNRRWVDMTDELRGDSSLWCLDVYATGYFRIYNAYESGERYWNLRSSGVVGTFQDASSTNMWFYFYDHDGNFFVPEDKEPNLSYGTTNKGYYWENTGLDMPVVLTTDTQNPVLYKIQNTRSQKYMGLDKESGELAQTLDLNSAVDFYFVKAYNGGVNIYSKDGMFVSGYPSRGSYVMMDDGSTNLNDNIWCFDHNYAGSESAGYGIQLLYSSLNNWIDGGQWRAYWNDYYENEICYYQMDNGSTFKFYSKDARHRDYLKKFGILLMEAGDVSNVDFATAIDTFLINGKTIVYDARNKIYMESLKKKVRLQEEFTAPVYYTLKDNMPEDMELRIDDDVVQSGEKYTFTKLGGNQNYTLSLWFDGKKCASAQLTFTFLPIVEINGTSLSSTYHPGSIRVNDPSTTDAIDSLYNCNLRYRGATAAGQSKKAFAIKLKNANYSDGIDRKLLDLREDNNWILDAAAIDPSRMRNRVSTDLWMDFSTPPYQAAFENKVRNYTRGKFVEVIMNGQYQGLYCMTEKIDRKQLKLKKLENDYNLVGSPLVPKGTLMKSASWSYSIFMGHNSDSQYYPRVAPAKYNNYSETWDGWEYKYPDLGDGEPITWAPFHEAISVPAATTDKEFKSYVASYFDLPVWRDYYLFLDLILATDNHGKNMYIYNYDITNTVRTSLTPWDLDGTWGRRWEGSTYYTSDATQDWISFIKAYEHGEHTLIKRLCDLNCNGWNEGLEERWAELRHTYFDTDLLTQRFQDYADLFFRAGADVREQGRWSNTCNYANEINFIRSWIDTRITTLDAKYNYDATGIKKPTSNYLGVTGGDGCIYIHVTHPTDIHVVNLAGQTVRTTRAEGVTTKIDGLQKGFYIVNNKKVLVK